MELQINSLNNSWQRTTNRRRRLHRCSSDNLSWRIGEFALISATGSWLPELQAGQISICRVATGEITNGIHPSMESGFHLQILQNRSDVNVVLHCQSIYATTIACMKKKPDNFNVSIEIPCYCGREICHRPLLSSRFGRISEGCQRSLLNHDAALLEKHGQVYAGKDLKSTIKKAEFLEMACEIMIHSGMNYNPLTLPEIEELEQYLRGKHR